jgi:hypothetical protein
VSKTHLELSCGSLFPPCLLLETCPMPRIDTCRDSTDRLSICAHCSHPSKGWLSRSASLSRLSLSHPSQVSRSRQATIISSINSSLRLQTFAQTATVDLFPIVFVFFLRSFNQSESNVDKHFFSVSASLLIIPLLITLLSLNKTLSR